MMNADAILDLGMDRLFLLFTTWLLTMARFVGFLLLGPIWGSRHIKPQVRVGFIACLSMIIWPYIPIPTELPGGPVTLILLILVQVFVGLVISYVSHIILAIAQFGGQIVDIQMGLSSAVASDPMAKGRVNLIQRLQLYFILMIFLNMNFHHVMLRAIVRSFQVIPLTGARFSGTLMYEMIGWTSRIFYVGVQIAIPCMGALFMIQIALGIMARVAPQMNVFMLSFPLNIITGLTMLGAAMPFLVRRMRPLFEENADWVYDAIKYMMP